MPENLSEGERLELWREYDAWVMQGACTHPFMNIASEHIANWGGLRAFQHALHRLGEGSYVALLREMPNSNGGLTKPAEARMCLAELDRFCSTGPFGHIVQLVDSSSDEVIHSRIEPYEGWFGTDGATGISYRLTTDGTFQIERCQAGVTHHDAAAETIFRSIAFSQARMPAGDVCLTDLSSGEQVICSYGLRNGSGRYPARLNVKQDQDSPARYAYCVEPLRRVFQAAVDTGHPVFWT